MLGDSALKSVGYIGLGSMGMPMAKRLLAANVLLHVFDRNEKSVQSACALGAKACSSPRDVANNSEVVIACLPSTDASRDVAFGPHGVVHGTKIRVYVEHSTVGSVCSLEIAEALAARSIGFVDSPVAGGVEGAEVGELSMIVSGEPTYINQVRPILTHYSARFLEVSSRPGDAQILKLANNMICNAELAVATEAILFAVKSGIPAANALAVINECTARNFATFRTLEKFALDRKFSTGCSLDIMNKDMTLFLTEAARVGTPTFVNSLAKSYFDRRVARGEGAGDVSEIIMDLEDLAGVKISRS
jgi:3-hydroxyisobutyrate dehydrogenase-like beta-hydroxyacid dehydrogenase